jgi:hypothetical protein
MNRNAALSLFFTRASSLLWQKWEALVWIIGLLLMATMDPANTHASLCPLNALGFHWCPGCGLGHSIAWLFRADPVQSFQTHALGIPAVMIIVSRTIHLIFQKPNQTYYGTSNSVHS